MGTKYCITFTRNGLCPYNFDSRTNHLLVALWYFFTLSIKYPIVTFEIRRGYIDCEKCTADWCDKSPKYSFKWALLPLPKKEGADGEDTKAD